MSKDTAARGRGSSAPRARYLARWLARNCPETAAVARWMTTRRAWELWRATHDGPEVYSPRWAHEWVDD